jgi:ubiquinone/menaquinone biosynthesis C-methylase UbiE/uncharacterized protein YbaR (Trm112 family)
MITANLIEQIRCPACGSRLHSDAPADGGVIEEERLQCTACESSFPICDGVADLIPYAALTGPVWDRWMRHLDGFASRRRQRTEGRASGQQIRWSRTHAAFFEFADLPPGNVLDIGCGPAGFRTRLDPARNTYYGLDPLPEGERRDFPFVRGVAERIPFQDGTFAVLVVSSALDHFCDAAAFFGEALRVLVPNGKLLIQQSIHDAHGASGVAKMLVHRVKDAVDNWRTASDRRGAPKHITEYTRAALVEATHSMFAVEAVREFCPAWYSPSKLFVALRPLAA